MKLKHFLYGFGGVFAAAMLLAKPKTKQVIAIPTTTPVDIVKTSEAIWVDYLCTLISDQDTPEKRELQEAIDSVSRLNRPFYDPLAPIENANRIAEIAMKMDTMGDLYAGSVTEDWAVRCDDAVRQQVLEDLIRERIERERKEYAATKK